MPIFEYKCGSCGNQFEIIHSFSDNSIQKCPLCNCEANRLISSPSFQLKGGGWYNDGYCSPNKNKGSTKNNSKDACVGCPNAKV